MKSMNLPKMSTAKPKFVYSKPTVSIQCPNYLKQQFNPTKPNRVWVSDISYIPIKKGFVYLCVILDLYARKVIAWKIQSKMTSLLVLETLQSALNKRQLTDSLLFHSNRGVQYTSKEVRQFLDHHGITSSYSKKGYPWDNAVTESFFKHMKKEELSRRTFQAIQEVRLSSFEFIEGFYNSKRPHSTNNMMTPNYKEQLYFDSL